MTYSPGRSGIIAVFTAASERFAEANIQSSIAQSLSRFRAVATRSAADGVYVRGYVSTVFDCPYGGPVEPEAVRSVVAPLASPVAPTACIAMAIDLNARASAAARLHPERLLLAAVAAFLWCQ